MRMIRRTRNILGLDWVGVFLEEYQFTADPATIMSLYQKGNRRQQIVMVLVARQQYYNSVGNPEMDRWMLMDSGKSGALDGCGAVWKSNTGACCVAVVPQKSMGGDITPKKDSIGM